MTQLYTQFVGLAPFARLNARGEDLTPICQQLLQETTVHQDNPNLWMNLSTVLFCLKQREIGLSVQSQALDVQRSYFLAAAQQPARLTLLLFMLPGDISANTPLDCLLEHSDIDLIYYYLSDEHLFVEDIPEHDLAMVAFSELEDREEFIQRMEHVLTEWPRPVINPPTSILATKRDNACRILQDIPGLYIPSTHRISREHLQAVADASLALAEVIPAHTLPIIIRPLNSHAGRNLVKIETLAEIGSYLSQLDDDSFFLSKFIDYSGSDGLFRKYRIAIINGVPFASHMAISEHWMIHYVNAGMYEDAAKRNEERQFMENFPEFVARHGQALHTIYQRTGLEYVCIDCAETPSGELLIFEIDHAMVVHAMDDETMFPHKQLHIAKAANAFRDMLLRKLEHIQLSPALPNT